MSQDELDAIAVEQDAGLGGTMLAAVYDFSGGLSLIPASMHMSRIRFGSHTRI
jgi:hypothetical protein